MRWAARWARGAARLCWYVGRELARLARELVAWRVRRTRAQIVWLDAHATPVLVSAMIMLALLGFARITNVTDDLATTQRHLAATQHTLLVQQRATAKAQAAACKLRRAGRRDTNLHTRVPLKGMANYLGRLALTSAATQHDPKLRAASIKFGMTFLAYAAEVKTLANPKC